MGCRGQIWWENREEQVNRSWPHSPGGQVSVYRLYSRRKHPFGGGSGVGLGHLDCVPCRGIMPSLLCQGVIIVAIFGAVKPVLQL